MEVAIGKMILSVTQNVYPLYKTVLFILPHSSRSESTGLARAAASDMEITVSKAITTVIKLANTKKMRGMEIRYANEVSQ